MREAVIVSTARTGLAKSFRGALNNTHGAAMGGHATKHAIARAGIDAAEHAESGYDLGGVGASRARSVLGSTLPTRADTVTESEVRA